MQILGYEFPGDLYYDEHHQYARVDGEVATMGLTAYAQSAAKSIVFVELPRKGRRVEQGKAVGSIESGKWVGRLYAVVTGDVLETNSALDDNPELVNSDPYSAGWLVRLRLSNPGDLSALRRCTDPAFAAWFAAELDKNTAAAKG
jgi:glycine cleavage system H protein